MAWSFHFSIYNLIKLKSAIEQRHYDWRNSQRHSTALPVSDLFSFKKFNIYTYMYIAIWFLSLSHTQKYTLINQLLEGKNILVIIEPMFNCRSQHTHIQKKNNFVSLPKIMKTKYENNIFIFRGNHRKVDQNQLKTIYI